MSVFAVSGLAGAERPERSGGIAQRRMCWTEIFEVIPRYRAALQAVRDMQEYVCRPGKGHVPGQRQRCSCNFLD